MRTFIKAVIILAVLGGLGYFGSIRGLAWLAERNKPRFRIASVEQGDLRITVNAAGQLEPTLSVKIGSFVSGPILELLADHNDEVKADQVLARIDPRIYIASVQRDEAALGAREGDVARVQLPSPACPDHPQMINPYDELQSIALASSSCQGCPAQAQHR